MGRETQAGRDRLLETDVAEVGVGDVADEDPSDLENALPLVGSPNGAAACVIDLPTEGVSRSACRRESDDRAYRCQHLGHAAEMPAASQ